MGTDETTGDEALTEADKSDEAEVTGQAMGIPSPLGSIDPVVPGVSTARKAGEKPVEYLKVEMDQVFITPNS